MLKPQYSGQLMGRADSLGKDPDSGKDWRQEKGGTADGMVDGITDSIDMSLSKLWEIVRDMKPGVLQSMGSQRVGHDLMTKHNNKLYQCSTWRFWGRLGPGVLCCSACTWPNISGNKNKINYKGIKTVAVQWGKLWIRRYKDTKNPTATSKELEAKAGYCACPTAHTTTKGVNKPPKPPLQPNPWTHPFPHCIKVTSSLPWGSQ